MDAPPSWTWHDQQGGRGRPAAPGPYASGDRGTPRTADDDWATTSGFASHPAYEHDARPGPSSAASSVSWTTESARARTPTDSSRDPREYNYEYDHDDYEREYEHEHRRRRPTRQEEEQARFRRRYKARTCRICLDTIEPTFIFDEDDQHDHDHGHEDPGIADVDGLGGVGAAVAALGRRAVEKIVAALPPFLQPASLLSSFSSMTRQHPRVMYISESPEDGRLISPCHCKGSQKYVHEGCVQRWRHARPLEDRNFWKCPTCGFEYRIERLRWSRLVSNRVTRALLTGFVFLLTLFILGFIADPLIDLWSDPAGSIVGTLADLGDMDLDDSPILLGIGGIGNVLHADGDVMEDEALDSGWPQHFLKGLFSLGIVGVIKTFLMVSPFTWWSMRGAGLNRGRRRAVRGGTQRFDSMGWVFILVGALTFLGAAWKGISYLSARVLQHASDNIADIGGGGPDVEDDDDDDDEDNDDDGVDADHPHEE